MPLSEPRIPNNPLTGPELIRYTEIMLNGVIEQRGVLSEPQQVIVVSSLISAMKLDCYFNPGTLHRNVIVEISLDSHSVGDQWAYDLSATFTLPDNMNLAIKPFVRRPAAIKAPPVKTETDEEHMLDCFTIKVALDNPNAIRVRCGIPIITVDKIDPRPGELFPRFERREHTYPTDSAPPLPAPSITERGAECAAKWLLDKYSITEHVSAPIEPTIIPQTPVRNIYPPNFHDAPSDLGEQMIAEASVAVAEPPEEPAPKHRGRRKVRR